MRGKRVGVFVILGLAGAGAAFAHGGATGIVKERMDAMSEIGDSMKSVGRMLKSGPYDPDVAFEAGAAIAGHAGEALTELFPEGSLQPQSEANPAIWSDWPTFEDYAGDLRSSALTLKTLAEDGADKQQLADAFGELAGTCKACHQEFRVKK
ncbi:c-type cytochrome [Roseibium marinum]|uniref:Cytochrome c556 n=1 Tax=Roseibium marinum TaxID=281252 RepID=A0A2S3V2S8_9HYPH|nr:cytochrome c [Roseibium marinum]POF34292.1 cytochrome c556 [Roseibium marinum]